MPPSERAGGAAPRPHARRRTLSIAARLTLLYACFATLLAGGVAWAVFTGMARFLEREDRELQDDALVNLAPMADGAAASPARFERLQSRFANAMNGWGYRLECPAGPSAASPLAAAIPAERFPEADAKPAIAYEQRVGARVYHLGALRLSDGCALYSAFDATGEAESFSSLRKMLALLTVVAGLLAAIAGGLIARAGLRPLSLIRERARTVTVERLAEPLGATRWPVELEELAAEFDSMLARLAAAFARLDGYAGDLAHELRTPLANLTLGAELALEEKSPARQHEALESLLEEARRLRTLVDRLLLIARAERPDSAAARRRFSLASLLDRLAALYAAAAAERAVTLRTDWPPGLEIDGDETLVRQAAGDLIDNALRHARKGGEIRLSASRAGGATQVTVEDDGEGIPPEALPRLFERYYRAADRHGGLGLGLALVRGVMKLHGGEAAACNRPEGGARFTLRFPDAPALQK